MSSGSIENGKLQELPIVCRHELADIKKRRDEIGLSSDKVDPGAGADQRPLENDLFGVALSGGGLRSASFNLGTVQALHKYGLWKYVDYLSTVSGGGYIGSYLTSASIKAERPFTERDFPLREEDGRQPPAARRFIYGGGYLIRLWQFANTYLVGLFFINLAVFSGIIAACALLALLWRCCDYAIVSDPIAMLGIGSDLTRPFWPFMLFALAWLSAWLVSLFRRGGDATGSGARRLLVLTVASFLVGCAVLVGNGDIGGISGISTFLGGKDYVSGYFWGPILALILGGLLPFLSPKRLLKSGLNPDHPWERYVFAIACTALLVGMPLIIVSLLAQENISRYNDNAHREIVRADVADWDAFCSLFNSSAAATDDRTDAPQRGMFSNLSIFRGGSDQGNKSDVAQQRPSITDQLKKFPDQLKELQKETTELQGKLRELDVARVVLHDDVEWRTWRTPHEFKRAYWYSGWMIGDDNPVTQYWDLKTSVEGHQEKICGILNGLLQGPDFFKHSKESYVTRHGGKAAGVAASIKSKEKSSPLAKAQQQRTAQLVEKALTSGIDLWQPHQFAELNRLMLEHDFENVFRPRYEIRRRVSIEKDQIVRGKWFLGALFVFLFAGIWVDLNACSLHRYYRSRIEKAFIVARSEKNPSVALSELRTTAYGSPYHLISGTVELFRQQLSFFSERQHSDEQEQRWEDLFLFSYRYCGSEVTGYIDTETYERQIVGRTYRVDLADATAISGAALSPSQTKNWLLAFLMVVLNFRLGQWLPMPKNGKPRSRPHFFSLFASLWKKAEDRPYCYVTDGGHRDNLGLVQLLKRRCRLIMVMDASHDDNHSFAELARVMRISRIHGGVRFVQCDAPDGEERDFNIDDLKLPKFNVKQEPMPDCQKHYTLARILYRDGTQGLMVYIKPSFDGDESVDLNQYRADAKGFPHEDSTDQMFDDAQVEAYRQLGFHIGSHVFRLLKSVQQPQRSLWNAGSDFTPNDLYQEFLAVGIRNERDRKKEKVSSGGAKPDSQDATFAADRTGQDGAAGHGDANPADAFLVKLRSYPPRNQAARDSVEHVMRNEFSSADTAAIVQAVQSIVVDDTRQKKDRKHCARLLTTFHEIDSLAANLPRSLEVLMQALEQATLAGVRVVAADQLGILGRGHDEVKRCLAHAAQHDRSERVRDRARYALENIERGFPK